jgi:ubiquinol-cytochrome c reductase iron-sulfur subunit
LSAKDAKEPTRRDFIFLATGAMAVVGVASVAWPLVDQMNPDATALALSKIEVDISQIERGQSITIKWRGKPVFIRRRTDEEIQMASRVELASLPDNNARNYNLSPESNAADANRARDENKEWLVMVGVCTHLGCVPKGQSLGDSKGDFGGWYCPCHGSHYDTAGRIRKGPAAKNLDIPTAEFINQEIIRIG